MSNPKTKEQLLSEKIVEAIDDDLTIRKKKYATLAYANQLLLEKKILTKKDHQNKLLKSLLVKGYIKHAYQTDRKPRQWRIPISAKKKKTVQAKKTSANKTKNIKRTLPKECPYCETELTRDKFGVLFCPFCNMNIEASDFGQPAKSRSKTKKKNSNGWYQSLPPTKKKAFRQTLLILFVFAIVLIPYSLYLLSDEYTNSSYPKTKTQSSFVKQVSSKYVGRKYDVVLAEELYQKYGYPETLNGTDNNVWIVYYPKGNFTMIQRKIDHRITGFEDGRNPR